MVAIVKLRLNTDNGAGERIKQANEKRNQSRETIDEAWQRIFAMKLTDSDQRKLTEVRDAMRAGLIGRDPSDSVDKRGNPKKFSKAEALRLYAVLTERQREETLRKMVEETPANYSLITTERQLEQLLAELANESIIAVDTETTGLDVYSDEIVGISLTLPNADRHVYIPVGHEEGEQLSREYVMGMLRPMLESEKIGKVFHNAVFDIHMFLSAGIKFDGLRWDTQNAMHVLNENEPSFRLKDLATKYLNAPSDTFDVLFGKNTKFNTVPLDVALVYAAKDTHLTWRLYEFQRKHLTNMPTILEYFESIEVPLIKAVVAMERTGFVIDVAYAREYGKKMKRDIDEKEHALKTKLGDINLNSPAQLKPALEKVTKQKLDSTDAKKVLKPLAKKFDVVAELLEYKELVKLYSTYISVLPNMIHPKTNRLHARFNPMGARTGRFSSGGNGVNLQNQPKSARKLFVAPEGWVIIGGDFSQQEVRCLAYMTQEPTLIEAYANGRDVYSSMASEVYGKPYEECGDGTFERKAMKVGVLSCMYGTGPTTLAQQLGVTVDEAKAFIDDFFRRLPNVKRWIDETKSYCKKRGYVWMDKQQRKRRLPDAKQHERGWENRGEIMRALRQGPNAIIQGTSAIQTKTTLIKLNELCERKGWKLWATVHDEALVLAPETITREDIAEFENVMLTGYVFGNVPNKTDIEIMRRWGEGVTVDEWFARKEKEETE